MDVRGSELILWVCMNLTPAFNPDRTTCASWLICIIMRVLTALWGSYFMVIVLLDTLKI